MSLVVATAYRFCTEGMTADERREFDEQLDADPVPMMREVMAG